MERRTVFRFCGLMVFQYCGSAGNWIAGTVGLLVLGCWECAGAAYWRSMRNCTGKIVYGTAGLLGLVWLGMVSAGNGAGGWEQIVGTVAGWLERLSGNS